MPPTKVEVGGAPLPPPEPPLELDVGEEAEDVVPVPANPPAPPPVLAALADEVGPNDDWPELRDAGGLDVERAGDEVNDPEDETDVRLWLARVEVTNPLRPLEDKDEAEAAEDCVLKLKAPNAVDAEGEPDVFNPELVLLRDRGVDVTGLDEVDNTEAEQRVSIEYTQAPLMIRT